MSVHPWASKWDLRLLVDGVSSFGAEEIDFADRSLTAACSRTYYLDLGRLAGQQEKRNTPFTPAVHAYYALVEALREFEEQGGRSARYRQYAMLAEQVRGGACGRSA